MAVAAFLLVALMLSSMLIGGSAASDPEEEGEDGGEDGGDGETNYANLPHWDGQTVYDGGAGDDSLTSDDDDSYLFGSTGADTLTGGAGNDVLDHYGSLSRFGNHPQGSWYEDAAADVLDGGAGDDLLVIGSGDTATGGAGADHIALFIDRDPYGGGPETYVAATLTDFNASADTLAIQLDLPEAPPELYEITHEIRTAEDGAQAIWITATRYDALLDPDTGERIVIDGAFQRDPDSAEIIVEPLLAVHLGPDSVLSGNPVETSITITPFWDEVS